MFVTLCAATAAGNGNKAKKEVYEGNAGRISFSVELEPILFQLNTVQNRYRLVRIRIVNDSSAHLTLSGQDDKVVLVSDSGEADAILNLGRRDAALWDGLDSTLRSILAYPLRVPAGEEESVFAFVLADRVKQAPRELRYTVAALNQRVTLLRRGTARAE
jgi:hypothetical protein